MTSADTPQRRGRIALSGTAATAVVATMIGMLFAGSTLVTPLYIMYKQAFGFSQISLTLIYAAYVIGNLCGLMFFGRLSDQIGRKTVAAAGMIVMIIAALVFLSASGVAALYAGRILSGLAIGVGAGTGTAWLSELIDDETKSRATVIATSANFIGSRRRRADRRRACPISAVAAAFAFHRLTSRTPRGYHSRLAGSGNGDGIPTVDPGPVDPAAHLGAVRNPHAVRGTRRRRIWLHGAGRLLCSAGTIPPRQ